MTICNHILTFLWYYGSIQTQMRGKLKGTATKDRSIEKIITRVWMHHLPATVLKHSTVSLTQVWRLQWKYEGHINSKRCSKKLVWFCPCGLVTETDRFELIDTEVLSLVRRLNDKLNLVFWPSCKDLEWNKFCDLKSCPLRQTFSDQDRIQY